MTSAQRRAQIIDAAVALFGRHGLKGTTTKSLAQAAGVSEATIFKHFPTKDALHAEAFERRTAPGSERFVATLQELADRGDDEAVLRELFGAILSGYEADRDLHRMLLYGWLEQDRDENRRLWAAMLGGPIFTFLRRYIRQRQAEGTFSSDAAPDLLASTLVAPAVQHAVGAKLYGLDPKYPDTQVAETFARLLLDGLRGGGHRATARRDDSA
jgi:AcrR family transcriptional regulator